jgi:hypothetical protein
MTTGHPKRAAAEIPARTRMDVEEREAALKRTSPVVRAFCQRFFYGAPDIVTDAQLVGMSIA